MTDSPLLLSPSWRGIAVPKGLAPAQAAYREQVFDEGRDDRRMEARDGEKLMERLFAWAAATPGRFYRRSRQRCAHSLTELGLATYCDLQ
jgi:hypothetical protein